tara:strand:- start:69049 stop:69492 length:444 start_codon:yes stop_codon:yes gene_type:complete
MRADQMRFSNHRQKRKPISDINIVPYIDVMLVLLVIFMITAPLLQQGVNVNLPQANAKVLSAKERMPAIVSVNKKGQLFLNTSSNPNIPVTNQALTKAVQSMLQKNPKRTILVKGDTDTNYGNVVKAMVLLQQAGVKDVGLMTQDAG